MTPFYTDDWLTLYGGDCRTVLASLPADSVDCVVTSPPYYSLRDYGHADQIGLEPTVEEYVGTMVEVFRQVRRVCKPTATVWVNLGDSFMPGKQLAGVPWRVAFALQADGWYLRSDIIWSKPNPMPESVTDRPTKSHEYLFLLTKSARYFFDSDAVREADSGQDHRRAQLDGQPSLAPPGQTPHRGIRTVEGRNGSGRNIRSVWNIATRPYPGAHFAVFPPELPERCIKAGSSQKGVCPECGAPWERVVERYVAILPRGERSWSKGSAIDRPQRDAIGPPGNGLNVQPTRTSGWRPTCKHKGESDGTTLDVGGMEATEAAGVLGLHPHGDEGYQHEPRRADSYRADGALAPAVILDPFGGSGTVGMVANRLSRRAILIDLNPEYLVQQMKRNAQTPLGLDAA